MSCYAQTWDLHGEGQALRWAGALFPRHGVAAAAAGKAAWHHRLAQRPGMTAKRPSDASPRGPVPFSYSGE